MIFIKFPLFCSKIFTLSSEIKLTLFQISPSGVLYPVPDVLKILSTSGKTSNNTEYFSPKYSAVAIYIAFLLTLNMPKSQIFTT